LTTDREVFLKRVRQAVAAGNRPGAAPPLPERGGVGYQGAGGDPLARFQAELSAAGGQYHVVADADVAVDTVLSLLRARRVRRVLLGGGVVMDALPLAAALKREGVEIQTADAGRNAYFRADAGVTGVEQLLAESGSLAVETRPDQPRSLSLLPPLHIAVARRAQLLLDLFDLFPSGKEMPSCLTLITGPSKTGDIELRLITGVHGPGEVHVVLIDGPV
jgi:L-lactate utilization protein LutC